MNKQTISTPHCHCQFLHLIKTELTSLHKRRTMENKILPEQYLSQVVKVMPQHEPLITSK